ncbi:MAG: M15 family metallopeptidase [Flavobacteriales bacterium]
MQRWRALPVLGWYALMACGEGVQSEDNLPRSNGNIAEAVQDSISDVKIPPLRELMGRVSPAHDSAFAPIPSELCSRDGMHLRVEARDSFVRMHEAAAAEGISLTALSATRTFGHQASIWNRKWNGAQRMGMAPVDRALDILQFSSMPGSSRHHWGTDVDMHSLEPADFEHGEGARTLAWLRAHAGNFGFVEVYTPEPGRPGYQPEAWHWSYAPLSVPFLNAVNEASPDDKREVFEGFDGAFLADSVDIFGRYVNGVSAEAAGR